jgi:hypothetical protein
MNWAISPSKLNIVQQLRVEHHHLFDGVEVDGFAVFDSCFDADGNVEQFPRCFHRLTISGKLQNNIIEMSLKLSFFFSFIILT